MTRHDRELRKELLLLKGEALRLRLDYELQSWRKPARMLAEGADLWNSLPHLKTMVSLIAVLLPLEKLRGLVKFGTKSVLVFQLLRRLLRKSL